MISRSCSWIKVGNGNFTHQIPSDFRGFVGKKSAETIKNSDIVNGDEWWVYGGY
jgi:hypothetical protein